MSGHCNASGCSSLPPLLAPSCSSWRTGDDAYAPSFPDRVRGPVFYRPACCIKPAARDFYPDWDRDDACCGELEFYRILAFRSTTASPHRGDDRNLFHRHLCSRGWRWPRDGYCRLPALPDNERRSIRPAQRMRTEFDGLRPDTLPACLLWP